MVSDLVPALVLCVVTDLSTTDEALAKLNGDSEATLTSAIEAALAKSPPDPNSPALSQTNTANATPSPQRSGSRKSSEDEHDSSHEYEVASEGGDTVGKLVTVNDKLASLDKLQVSRPLAVPVSPSNSGSQQPDSANGAEDDEDRMRRFRQSSKLSPVTGAVRMETVPSGSSMQGRMSYQSKTMPHMKSSETIGTIDTIATEVGDLDDFAAFLNRSDNGGVERRPQVRRQTTSQSSRFVEIYHLAWGYRF